MPATPPPTAASGGVAPDPPAPSLLGRRFAALVVDGALSALVAGLFTRPEAPRQWSSVALIAEYVFFLGFFVQTPGMRLLGLRCVRLADGRPLGVPRALLRVALLFLVVPALVVDDGGRGAHDRAAGSVVRRT